MQYLPVMSYTDKSISASLKAYSFNLICITFEWYVCGTITLNFKVQIGETISNASVWQARITILMTNICTFHTLPLYTISICLLHEGLVEGHITLRVQYCFNLIQNYHHDDDNDDISTRVTLSAQCNIAFIARLQLTLVGALPLQCQ